MLLRRHNIEPEVVEQPKAEPKVEKEEPKEEKELPKKPMKK